MYYYQASSGIPSLFMKSGLAALKYWLSPRANTNAHIGVKNMENRVHSTRLSCFPKLLFMKMKPYIIAMVANIDPTNPAKLPITGITVTNDEARYIQNHKVFCPPNLKST